MGDQQDPFSKLEMYRKQRKIAFVSVIACCMIAFICGADTFEKVSTWFWIMMSVAALIISLSLNSKYNAANEECAAQKASQHDKEIHELEKEIESISNSINGYKREATQYENENRGLKEQISALEADKVRLREEIDSLHMRLRMQNKEAENSTGRLSQYIAENRKLEKELEAYTNGSDKVRWENERLKCEVDGLRKLLSEKEKSSRIMDKPQGEQVKQTMSIDTMELPIDRNVDEVLSRIAEEPVGRANPISSKVIIETPLHLSKRYKATQAVLNGDYTVFDIETTGLSKSDDEIIELSAVRFRGFHAERTFTTLIDPGRHIPSRITEITGISDEDVKSAPVLEEIKDSFLRFVGTDALIGHNIRAFDLGFLHRRGFNVEDPERTYLDTLNISRRLISKEKIENHKLDTLLKYFEITRSSGHRGEIDSAATGVLFAALVNLAREQGKVGEIG